MGQIREREREGREKLRLEKEDDREIRREDGEGRERE